MKIQTTQDQLKNNPDCVEVAYNGASTSIRKNIVSPTRRGFFYGAYKSGETLYIFADDQKAKPDIFKLVNKPKPAQKKRGRKPRQSKIEVSE